LLKRNKKQLMKTCTANNNYFNAGDTYLPFYFYYF